jgi:alpha-D-ribose 1-methylphosphonate 5-triphosphate diphosphatase
MIAKGLCSILASDYYYPAQLLAAFRLVEDRHPVAAAGLVADLVRTGKGRRAHRPRRDRGRAPRRSPARR